MSIKKKTLKSGIKYSFTLRYKDIYGNTKQYTSKGYNTKREAELEEAKFRIKIQEKKIIGVVFKKVKRIIQVILIIQVLIKKKYIKKYAKE